METKEERYQFGVLKSFKIKDTEPIHVAIASLCYEDEETEKKMEVQIYLKSRDFDRWKNRFGSKFSDQDLSFLKLECQQNKWTEDTIYIFVSKGSTSFLDDFWVGSICPNLEPIWLDSKDYLGSFAKQIKENQDCFKSGMIKYKEDCSKFPKKQRAEPLITKVIRDLHKMFC